MLTKTLFLFGNSNGVTRILRGTDNWFPGTLEMNNEKIL